MRARRLVLVVLVSSLFGCRDKEVPSDTPLGWELEYEGGSVRYCPDALYVSSDPEVSDIPCRETAPGLFICDMDRDDDACVQWVEVVVYAGYHSADLSVLRACGSTEVQLCSQTYVAHLR